MVPLIKNDTQHFMMRCYDDQSLFSNCCITLGNDELWEKFHDFDTEINKKKTEG